MFGKKKLLLVLSIATIMTFLTSCSPDATTEPTNTSIATNTQTPTKTTAVPSTNSPKYGGKITLLYSLPTAGFDPFLMSHTSTGTIYFTQEELFTGNWAKGPGGTNETSFLASFAAVWTL